MKCNIFIYLFILFLFFCTGCDFYSEYNSIHVLMPEIPGHWYRRFGEIYFTLYYPDINGEMITSVLAPGENECTINLSKIMNCPIIVQPYGAGFTLKPAGAVYPWHMDMQERVLHVTWEHGFTARLLKECYEIGFDISRFNAQRLMSEINDKSEGDPWKLDFHYITEKIAGGNFRVTDIKPLPVKDFRLAAGKGSWFFLSPFSTVFTIEDGELFCFENIPSGNHRLLRLDSEQWYDIFLSEQETNIVYYEN